MNGIDNLASQLRKTIDEKDKRKKTGYYAQSEVLKVQDNIVWVKIPGGVDETPVARTVDAKPGDTVQVRVENGRAWIAGNYTSPATDDTRANTAYIRAESADEKAVEAINNATIAKIAADKAVEDADRAYDAAESAEASAQQAEADATAANVAATQARADASAAHTAADNAQASADEALGSAIAANIASNSALTQLAVVEDVASVLTWISEHGTYKLSDDTAVVSGKLYFTRSGTDPDYEYTPITTPTGNPHTSNYYEIDTLGDEAVSNYISSHLALTNAGLWVVKDNSGYKILLANDGMRVYDAQGNLVVTYGTSIEFANNREFHIGNQNAYIVFNPANNGSITIGGSNIVLGSNKTLDQVLAEINNTFIFDVTYDITGTSPKRIATFEAHLYQGGVDIKTQYSETQFTWYLKTEDGEEPIIPTGRNHNHGYTTFVNISESGYGAEVIAHFTTTENSPLLTENDDNLTDSNNHQLTARTESGDSVRVSDLTVSTTIYPSEKIMIVGSEDEHLVTVNSLADKFWDIYDITIESQPLNKGNNNYEDIGLLSITNLEMDAIFVM